MEVNLESIETTQFRDSEKAILNVLKATLQYPANESLKAIKLANDIDFFRKSAEDGTFVGDIFLDIWWVLLDVVRRIPSGHPWQISLVQSLDNLRKLDGPIPEHEENPAMNSWRELPELAIYVRDHWTDSVVSNGEYVDDLEGWKNLNSFIARLTSTGFVPWFCLPIWQIREALEEPPVKGPDMECRLWIASEWILHCRDIIFEEMDPKEELNANLSRAFQTGSLYYGKPPLSIGRWNFWKSQFSKFIDDPDTKELGIDIIEKMSNALKCMDAVKE